MHPVITIARAGIQHIADPLVKAGDTRAHKYWKREPYFVHGKLRYRYWYNTPEDRERYRQEHDPSNEHEHHVKAEIARVHENLGKTMPKTAMISAEYLQSLITNMAPRGSDVKVHISAQFERAHKQPFVDAEAIGAEAERNPAQRIAKAFDMIPDTIRDLVSVRSLKITTRSDRAVKLAFEKADPPRPVPAAFSDRDGNITLCADGEGHGGGLGFNSHPSGWPKFGSPLTQSEEAVWREVGRQLRYALAGKRKEMWEEWKKIATELEPDKKLSAFARQNVDHDFMESFACMLSHPKQMAEQCPMRYEFFRKLMPGPSLEAVKATPLGQMSWWAGEKPTPARKLFHEVADKEKPIGVPYISPKDEFFQVSTNGRTVYMRIGPNSPDEEEGWERMPDTMDPVTGYPIFDTKVARAFLKKEQLKEIYDENGTRLSDNAAFLYLNQENVKVTDFKEASHRLSYMMYDGLGSSRSTAEEEHKAIKDMKRRGVVPEEKRADRWAKVPHPMSLEEFHAKTPSFSFEGMKAAEQQPFVAFDDGAPVKHINPMTGKQEIRLHSRVYEATNPDGTKTELVVREAPSFQYGDEVILPVVEYHTDEETGETFERTVEKQVTLDPREHPDISPKGLAKQHKIPVADMMSRNGVLEQYQLVDPIMASLINPSGVAIKDRASLMAMLRSAAEVQPERWVTLQINDDPPSHAHVKVKFDGAGSPLLVGEYWERKMGMLNPRVSDLVKKGKLRGVSKASEKKPHARKIKPGGHVRVNVDGNWVFAQLTERTFEDGKRRYNVTVLPDQGIGEPLQREVKQVRSIPTDRDVFRPNIRLREFRQPLRDVLVYVDEVRVNAAGDFIPGTGVVKIMLPSDGSWNFESMLRIPGVRTNEQGELILDPSSIDAFREEVGGFVTDDLAQQRMQSLSVQSKARADAGRAGKTALTDIVDPLNGNSVNTDKLLKGCRKRLENGAEFKLGSHQAELLKALADNDGRIIAAHFMGTGKTISAIAGIKMMQNLTTEDGKPHPNRPKRVAIVVPKSTALEWVNATATFTTGKATLLGAGGLAGALQMTKLPKEAASWPAAKKDKWLAEQRKKNPNLWNPDTDKDTDIIVIPQEYFTIHAEELKRTGGFDGLIVDEAHGIQNDNERSRAVEDWNPDMKMMMMLTGTPVTNKLTTVSRYLKLISNGAVDLGSEKQFEDDFLVESAVQKANGAKTAQKMDLNPQKMGELHRLMKPYLHVATTADVKGKTIPAVSLDENTPAKMSSIQAMLYRGYMNQLSPEDKSALEVAATLGEDERKLLGEEAQKKVRAARSITNSPGFKPIDGREFIVVEVEDPAKPGKMKNVEFRLPGWGELQRKYKGKWPSLSDVDKGRLSPSEYNEMARAVGNALGLDYETVSGKSIEDTVSGSDLKAIKDGSIIGDQGLKFGSRVPNPEYGPEGAICRGAIGDDGRVKPIEHVIRNADGSVKEVVRIPAGLRFIRDPGKKSAGLYYFGGVPEDHPARGTFGSGDWDFTRQVVDSDGDGAVRGVEKGQRPKEGMEAYSIQRHPERRRERMMFDLVMTAGNAKCDALEKYLGEKTDPTLGGNPDGQMILFGREIGSSVRTMESKLRLMGFKDVNEALNDSLRANGDPIPANGKYFVTYMGDEGTLGDRNINSEIFRKRKGPDGRDLKMSMFVHRSLHGSDGAPVKVGQIREGWSRPAREDIAKNFSGVEMPARVTAVEVKGTIEYRYAYESDMNPADRKAMKELEEKIDRSKGGDKEKLQAQMGKLLGKYWTERQPLTKRQMEVFNNCQLMVASDAAQVGLNWGNAADLVMYDSLFSPMQEWQRITRAARMLPPAISDKVRPTFDKLTALIDEKGKEDQFLSYEGHADGALAIVSETLDEHPELRQELLATGMNPAAIAESFLAQRSMDRINALRGPVEQQLRQSGRVLESAPKVIDPDTGKERFQFIKPEEITSSDVMNEILEKHLKPFEKQVLRSRKYLVDVKRLTTSVETPEMETVTVSSVDENGKKVKKKVERFTGRTKIEHPSKAERAVLMQGRAKQVPTEKFLNLAQQELPTSTAFDFIPARPSDLGQFAYEPRSEAERERDRKRREKAKLARRQEDIEQRQRHGEMQEIRAQEAAARKAARVARKAAEREAKKAAEKAAKAAEKEAKAAKAAAKAAKKQQAKDNKQALVDDTLAMKSERRVPSFFFRR